MKTNRVIFTLFCAGAVLFGCNDDSKSTGQPLPNQPQQQPQPQQDPQQGPPQQPCNGACLNGQTCNTITNKCEGKVIAATCENDSDCSGSLEKCEQQHCVQTCSSFMPCKGDLLCRNRYCVAPDCEKGEDCRSGLCENQTCKCWYDDQCGIDQRCKNPYEPRGLMGDCVNLYEMDVCADLDADGYYAATSYAPAGTNCSFGQGVDPDDYDPTVFPGAPEYCDGRDNNCDGCVDGICKVDGGCAGSDKSNCERLHEFCLGPIDATMASLEGTMCDPRAVGMRVCLGLSDDGYIVSDPADAVSATFVYVLPKADGVYIKFDPIMAVGLDPADYSQFYKDQEYYNEVITTCPKAESFYRTIDGVRVPYTDSDFADNAYDGRFHEFCGYDRDCNGIVGEGCESCDPSKFEGLTTTDDGKNCLVLNNGEVVTVDKYNKKRCYANNDKCGCYGTLSCSSEDVWSTNGVCNITINGHTYSFPHDGQRHEEERYDMLQANPDYFFECDDY